MSHNPDYSGKKKVYITLAFIQVNLSFLVNMDNFFHFSLSFFVGSLCTGFYLTSTFNVLRCRLSNAKKIDTR